MNMSLFGKKLKIDDSLFDLLVKAAEIKGASSPEELANEILAEGIEQIIRSAGKGDVSKEELDDITNKLKGLGYLD
jgi:hypothetical protein